jgi:diacylglycerol O-acyltransferase / wax synthase
MWFLTGLTDERIGMFVRLHHVVADGIAGVAELGTLLGTAPSSTAAPAEPWLPRPRPSDRALLVDNLQGRLEKLKRALRGIARPAATVRRARAVMPALRELLAEKTGPSTSLNRVIGQDRTLAVMRSSLDLVKETAHTP